MEEKNIINSKAFLNIFFSIFTVILIVFIVVSSYRQKDNFKKSECEQIVISGSYSYDGGATFNKLNADYVITPTRSNQMTIVGRFNKNIDDSKDLYLYMRGLKGKMLVNGKVVYEREDELQDAWADVGKLNIKFTDEVRFELYTEKYYSYNVNFVYFVDNIYFSTRYDLLEHKLKSNALSIIASMVIMILGFSMLIYRICFRHMQNYDSEGLVACGMMMIIGGLTCLLNYEYITLISRNLYLLACADQMSQAMIVMFLTGYMKRHMVSEKSKNRCNMFVLIMAALISIYLIKNMITNEISGFDPFFVTSVALVVVVYVYEIIELYKSGRRLSRESRMAFDSVVLLVLAFIVEMVFFILTGSYFIKIFLIALLIFSLLQYILLVFINVDNYRKAQKANELEHELSQNKIKMVISQIQPHFLYNAISTIRALCTRNPMEARNALDFFAKYLRANMDSLGEEGCIPFSKELDHVKSYLYIEKLRFGDLLDIQYDIDVVDFMCPPLTLQTMAENAVKHGLLPQKDGGRLKISTKVTENYYVIIIEDDGVGVDMTKPLENDGRSHIGLANTRQRIAGLCEGTLNVSSKIGVGTTITITLPKDKVKLGD